MTYDTEICFYKLPKDLEKDVSIVKIPDLDDGFFPYPVENFFVSI